MRKLLILVMIIGFTGAASAALQIDIYDGTAAYVDEGQAVNDTLELRIKGVDFHTAEMCWWGIACDTSDGAIVGGAVSTGAPNISSVDTYAYYIAYTLTALGAQAGEYGVTGGIWESTTATGPWDGDFIEDFTFTMKKSVAGTVTVKLYSSTDDYATSSVVTATIKSIPEPMTLALLGLGALFLRRRRA